MEPLNLQTAMAVIESAIATAMPAECPLLVGELERLKGQAWVKMMHGAGLETPSPSPTQQNGTYLTVQEVVDRFKVTAKWLYRHKKQMPYSQPSRKCLLFHEQAVAKWFASRKLC